jgi:hypothetical protein
MPAATAISNALNERALRQARSGNRDSGTWSSPIALLLAVSLRRRFKKLEKRSPAIAALPTSAPILNPRPTKYALTMVSRTERRIPRMVFDAPNKGSPSLHLAPLSRGRENRSPKIFFATTGVPFASIIRNSSRVITQSCIPSCYLSGLETSIDPNEFLQGGLGRVSYRTSSRTIEGTAGMLGGQAVDLITNIERTEDCGSQ